MTLEHAKQLRALIVKASASLPDADAVKAGELFPAWSASGKAYAAAVRVQYQGQLWRCLAAHVSQPGWNPTDAPSLWAKVLIPEPELIPDWEQPDSTNAYQQGDRVRHNGKLWVSEIDGNVWEPGVYGWTELSDPELR